MRGIIIEEGDKCFTFLKSMFMAMDNVQVDYNWLISDYECYPANNTASSIFSKEWSWITGQELTKIIEEEDFQWIWGVFSGFSKNISLEKILESELPFANGNEEIWKNPISMQHPLAEIELIAWDGVLTVLLSKNDELINTVSEKIPFAKDLKNYNDC